MKRIVALALNGRAVKDAIDDNTLLIDCLRNTHGLAGAKKGGGHRGGALGSTMGFSYAAQVVDEAQVDGDTGQIQQHKVRAALDYGFAVNPLAVEGQVQRSVPTIAGHLTPNLATGPP